MIPLICAKEITMHTIKLITGATPHQKITVMTKNEIIKKSKNYSRRIYQITRVRESGEKGWNVLFEDVLDFRTEHGEHYVTAVSTEKTAYVHGDKLESVNDWLIQFPTLDEARTRINRY